MNKRQLATKIWEAANKMRSKIEAFEYKDFILGLIFYKYLSEQEVRFLKSVHWTDEEIASDLVDVFQEHGHRAEENDSTEPDYYSLISNELGYFIAHKNLFSTWISMGSDFDISNVTDALSLFSRNINANRKGVFDKIFDTLQTGLSKLGATSAAQTKAIRDLIYLIRDIPMDNTQGYDVLGYIYEYLISQFAANAGKKAGEFYTPHEVSMLMSEIVAHHLRERDTIHIYDPTSGSGSLLLNIGQAVSKHMDSGKVKYYAQELNSNTYNLTRMNLVMRGISASNIFTRNADTLEEDWPVELPEANNPLYVDAVVSNPPYSQKWKPEDKDGDPRYANYGLAPKSKADYAFLLHDLYHLKPDGIVTIVLPHGVLFRGGEEGEIRKQLIENNNIDAIIGLPANIFFGTGIPTIIMVLRKNRGEQSDTMFIDASKGFVKEGKSNKLRACDMKRITDALLKRADVPKFARSVSRKEIRENEYNLNIPRYVDSSEENENWDLYASMFGGIPQAELQQLAPYWQAFPQLKETLFADSEAPYAALQVEELRYAINNHPSVKEFCASCSKALESFSPILEASILTEPQNLDVPSLLPKLSAQLFTQLKATALLNPYEAYQHLADHWQQVAIDLEIIQTEGMAALRKVDPNMVLTKKNGKEVEIQKGWVGRIFPFDLVQRCEFTVELKFFKHCFNEQQRITGEYENYLAELSEDQKGEFFVKESKDAFDFKEVKAAIKELKDATSEAEKQLYSIFKAVDELQAEEKKIKADYKQAEAELEEKTKAFIEGLTDAQAHDLLRHKWVLSLEEQLLELPEAILSDFNLKLEALAAKYQTTYAQLSQEISETEDALADMLADLEGNDFDNKALEELQRILKGA